MNKPVRKFTPQQVAAITASLVNEEKQRVSKRDLAAASQAMQAMHNGADLSLFEVSAPVAA